ncbi:MAG: hypothetical protein HQK83_17150 [Fibrobacteria bacterium]|nr:hypothetical protein [Fibrobacteria bacterium]
MANSFPPPLAHNVMHGFFPDLSWQIEDIAGNFRRQFGQDSTHIVSNEELEKNKLKTKILKKAADNFIKKGYPPYQMADNVAILFQHLRYMVNFTLHRRKTFWIEESLAWMFHRTELDIEGECLRLPFPSCLYVFSDAPSLELATNVLQQDPDGDLQDETVKICSCYMNQIVFEDGASELEVNWLFDAQLPEWPYLLSRNLYIHPHDDLDTILHSHCPDVAPENRDAIYTHPELKKLLHLALSSVLYSTSANLDMEVLESPISSLEQQIADSSRKRKIALKQKLHKMEKCYSKEDVFYLPGKIDISQYQALSSMQKNDKSGVLNHRIMVRGHWRRANPSWHDQKLRWIMPFWKGSEDAPVIEKEYRLRP